MMDRISFDIYIPDGKKFHWTPNWIILSAWFLTIGILWLFDSYIPPNSGSRILILVVVFGGSLVYLLISFALYKPLNGILKGKIIFEDYNIIVNDTVYKLTEISKLDFLFGDYYGESSLSGRDFDQKLYQGVSNYVTFTDSENQVHTIYFQVLGKHSTMTLFPLINEAVRLNLMSYYRAGDLIGDKNVIKPG